jgi:hypothetical protein
MHGLEKSNLGNNKCMSADIATEIAAILEIEWHFGLEIRCEIFSAEPATLSCDFI